MLRNFLILMALLILGACAECPSCEVYVFQDPIRADNTVPHK